MLWTKEDDESLEVVVGPYKLYVSSFKTLHGTKWLVEEVIDAFLNHLITNQQESVGHICAVVSTGLFDGQVHKLGKTILPEDVWVCPANVGDHWILVAFIISHSLPFIYLCYFSICNSVLYLCNIQCNMVTWRCSVYRICT